MCCVDQLNSSSIWIQPTNWKADQSFGSSRQVWKSTSWRPHWASADKLPFQHLFESLSLSARWNSEFSSSFCATWFFWFETQDPGGEEKAESAFKKSSKEKEFYYETVKKVSQTQHWLPTGSGVHSGRAHASLVTERSWVQIPLGAGLFSLRYHLSSAPLIQAPHGGATLLIFLQNKLSWAPWGSDWAQKMLPGS